MELLLNNINEAVTLNIYYNFIAHFVMNLVAVAILCYVIYYQRYHDKQAATSYILFNIFLFTVITILFSMEEGISVGLGFGLFAILSIIRLRSETFEKKEITYFFGILSLAIINAVGIDNFWFLAMCNALIVISAWIVDHPRIIRGADQTDIVLDHIPEGIFDNHEDINQILNDKFGLDVISFDVKKIDYVRDMVTLRVQYHTAK
jgi:hypothetical protein